MVAIKCFCLRDGYLQGVQVVAHQDAVVDVCAKEQR